MTRILITHAYSRLNSGDGLLVDETVKLVRRLWPTADLTIVASDPASFDFPGVDLVSSKPRNVRDLKAYLRTLVAIRSFDLVVAVGGGYLRARSPGELAKMTIIHGPQLLAAALRSQSVVYMPQSIGPFGPVSGKIVRGLLGRVELVCVRDDRSQVWLGGRVARRSMDLALLSDAMPARRLRSVNTRPVLSVRDVGRTGEELLARLADRLRPFDSLVQSSVGGNNDLPATRRIGPESVIEHAIDDGESSRRVVIAVRLHAALMAIHQGHYVIHLAYERKGFGAFEDLGLGSFVHNVYSFSVDQVAAQCRELLYSEDSRRTYDEMLNTRAETRLKELGSLLGAVRMVGGSQL